MSETGSNYEHLDESNRRFRQKISQNRGITPLDELYNSAARSIKTATIASLDCLENHFGGLWGEFLDESVPLSQEQERNEEIYERCRKAILDRGNAEIRRLEKEFTRLKIKESNNVR